MKSWDDQVSEHVNEVRAKRKAGVNRGLGCALQLPGVLFLVGGLIYFWPAAILGLLLILLGGVLCRRWLCGSCGNKIEKTASMCPVCRAHLS